MTASLASPLARDWILEVETATGVWTRVRGLTTCSPIFDNSQEDSSTIDDNGFASEETTGHSYKVEGSGKRKGDSAVGFTDDAGQDFLRKKARKSGVENKVKARVFRRDSLPEAYQNVHPVKWTDSPGSGINGLAEFSFTLGFNGEPEEITKPLVPSGTQVFSVGVGAATAGTFTLTWNGQTTDTIAFNATNATVKTALVALDDGYKAADFTVTGAAGEYVITVPGGVVTGDGTALTGGALTVVVNP